MTGYGMFRSTMKLKLLKVELKQLHRMSIMRRGDKVRE